jgi:putative phage-type endonuclease
MKFYASEEPVMSIAQLPIPADDRDTFLANRLTGIGGSDAAVALGLSPFRTALELYLEKRGEIPPTEETETMLWGKLLEPVIRQRYSTLTGRTVRVPPFMRHPKYEFVVAHPDGVTDDKRLFEAKTARSADGWGEPGTDAIPRFYLIQVQHYMMVTATPVADVSVLIGGSDFRTYEVPADAELQEMILEGEADFWRRVQAGQPPEPDYEASSTAALVRRMFPGTNGEQLIATQDHERWRQVYEQAAELAGRYASVAENAKLHLLYEMGGAATLTFADGKALRRKEMKKKGYTVEPTTYIDARFVNHKE